MKQNLIIAFAGSKQSGKTSSCEYIQTVFVQQTKQSSAIYNFADPLKQVCIDILGLTKDQCYGSDDNKNELVDCLWPDTNKKMTAREVMQYIGTDIFRKMQHNVWADATIRRIKNENLPLALIADCRFPNEIESIKNTGGIVIKLDRNKYHSTHASETALNADSYNQSNFDLVINNNNMNEKEKNHIIREYLSNKGILPL